MSAAKPTAKKTEEAPVKEAPAVEATVETPSVTDVVAADHQITDPESPDAVQVPDLEEASVPLHGFLTGKTVEEIFAAGE